MMIQLDDVIASITCTREIEEWTRGNMPAAQEHGEEHGMDVKQIIAVKLLLDVMEDNAESLRQQQFKFEADLRAKYSKLFPRDDD